MQHISEWLHDRDYGFDLPEEVIQMQRAQTAILNCWGKMMANCCPFAPTTKASFMRNILEQAHGDFAGTDQDGAWYVVEEEDVYELRPFGAGAWRRRRYLCRLDLISDRWVWVVMG
jgi:hypothetical protein